MIANANFDKFTFQLVSWTKTTYPIRKIFQLSHASYITKRVLCNKLGMFSREIVQKYFGPFLRKIFYCKLLHLPFFYDDEIRLID